MRASCPRRAPHVDSGAEPGGDVLIDIAQHHYSTVEGHDLAILGATGVPVRADIILAALAPL